MFQHNSPADIGPFVETTNASYEETAQFRGMPRTREISCRILTRFDDKLVSMDASDLELIQQFTRERSQPAFTELVHRHLNLVYSSALRQVRSPDLAGEVSQSVFLELARDAARLNSATVLPAWLYQVTRRRAIDVIRRESRRQVRERLAAEMATMNATPDPAANEWTQIERSLDDAMEALDDADRAAILLRFFENKSLREVGTALGASDDAAQKRVTRALERLRGHLGKRGVVAGAGGLAAVISANAVGVAPAGLAATITAAATALSAVVVATTATSTVSIINMKIIAGLLVTAITAGSVTHFIHRSQSTRLTGASQNPVALPAAPEVPPFAIAAQPAPNGNDPQSPQTSAPKNADIAALQGSWTGPEIGAANQGKAILIVTGTNLEFHGADTNEWYKASFVLHENLNPKQLIAVVTACPAPQFVGQTANAIYQFEASAFRLAGNEPGDPTMPLAINNAPNARVFLFQRARP
jgi:RNA polymerase sigma factor (sigma-70 family)